MAQEEQEPTAAERIPSIVALILRWRDRHLFVIAITLYCDLTSSTSVIVVGSIPPIVGHD